MQLFRIKQRVVDKVHFVKLSHFIEVAGHLENIGKSKQNSFLKDRIKCMSMRLLLASTRFFPKLLL